MEKILIIDDDKKIRSLLQQFLKNEGFDAETAENAFKAKELIENTNYDLLVVDVMMPGETGIEFTKKIKGQNKNIPILMLTAMGEAEDRISGLESGADDYLGKPFEPRELVLRAKKLIERFKTYQKQESQTVPSANSITFGDCEFNLDNFILTKGGNRVLLSFSEGELLALFCNNIGVSIDRYELAKKFNGISERSVDVQVTRLRKKIEDDPKAPRFIQTTRGKGYVFRV